MNQTLRMTAVNQSTRLARALLLGTALSMALGGCIFGPKFAKLDPKNVKAIDVILVGGKETFCASGVPVQLKVMATTADGKRVSTWAAGEDKNGKLDFAAFEWSTTAGAVDGAGLYHAPDDPFATLDKTVTIQARVAGNPTVQGGVTIEPAYDCGAFANFAGEPGASGYAGEPGRMGRNGESGDSSRAATDGERGGSGADARDGGHGGPGPEVEVAIGYVKSEKHGLLVVARVSNGGNGAFYALLDPKGAPLVVSASGGSGGDGGQGGAGGNGGFGGSNDIEGGGNGGHGGDGGDGGRGANGGDGGPGGKVIVRFDKAHPELRNFVRVENRGGSGGGSGSGGYGGSPGPGGSSASGQRGNTGRSGVSGQPGSRTGRPGPDGPPPRFSPEPGPALFHGELAAGVPIAK